MCMHRANSSDGAYLRYNSTLYNHFHFDWTNDAYVIHLMWRQKHIYPNGSLDRRQWLWEIIDWNLQGSCYFTRSHQSVTRDFETIYCVSRDFETISWTEPKVGGRERVGKGSNPYLNRLLIVQWAMFTIVLVRNMSRVEATHLNISNIDRWSLSNRLFKCGYRLSPNDLTISARQLNLSQSIISK